MAKGIRSKGSGLPTIGDQDPFKGGNMKPDRSTKGIKSKPHFGTKRIPNPPSDQNKGSYPR